MNFDIDDPLGSDDSFFEEPKALSKRPSLKSVETKSVENLFNLTEPKENVDRNKSMPDLPQKTKNIVTFDESTIKPDVFSKSTSDLGAKVQKKKNDDWLGEAENVSGLEKKTKRTDFLEDLLSSPKKKTVTSSEDIHKDSQFSTQSKSSGPSKEPSTPTDVLSNFSILSNTSRERRRSRRGSSSGFEDALGLFSDDYQSGDFYAKDAKPVVPKTSVNDTQPKTTNTTEKGIPDWLGGSAATLITKTDSDVVKKTQEHVKEDVNDDVHNNPPVEEDKPRHSSKITEEIEDHDTSIAMKQQQINLDLQNTYASLQHQETFLLISLQLKKYEENLEAIRRQQREILEKQEKRYDSMLDKYSVRQQMIENNIRLQQERLNNHVKLLISQPVDNGDGENSGENEIIKTPHNVESDTQRIIHSLKERHNEELFVVEESYKKQISLLEKSTDGLEERLKNEINYITTMFEEKINNITKNYNDEILFHKQKTSTMEEQHNRDIRLIKDQHAQVLEEMRAEHASRIAYLKEFSKKENELSANGQFYSQKLDTNIEILDSSTKLLQGVQERIRNDSEAISVARQSSIESREKEVILMRNTLEKCREAAENERSQLLALIRSLETKIAEQNVNAQEDRWALQQASATLTARSSALEREIEYNRSANEREREQLKTLRASLLAEQEKIVAQLTEEKLKLSAEKARIETSNKLSNNYESEKIKTEAEVAIQVAKDLSQKVSQERDYLYRQKNEIEILKRELADRERELQDKEMNLEYLIENTQKKLKNDKRVVEEAKRLENKYKERLQELQNQWASLADREKKLAEEKVLLSKERLGLYTAMKQTKTCVLCKAGQSNYYMEENLATLKMSDSHDVRIRLDAFDDDKGSEVSKEENNVLQG